MKKPTVSVCIPVYNGRKFIGAAIESVLAQSFGDFELVIADNCSTDGTVDVIRQFTDPRIRLIVNEQNLGPERNWNTVAEAAGADLVKLLCADDVLFPQCLERQVGIMQSAANAGVSICCGRRVIVDEEGRPRLQRWGTVGLSPGRVPGDEAFRAVVRSGTNPIGESCAVMFTAAAFAKAGGFSARRPYMIDVDLWVRMLLTGDLFVDNGEPVCAFRVSGGSWSNSLFTQQSAQARDFFREQRARHPEVITRADCYSGIVMATILKQLRRLFYGYGRLRARLD
jgi:glycosyltransferase involved in cell wall biosynthesis